MEWKHESDGSAAPGHERYTAVSPASGSRDSRYVVSRPAGAKEAGYIALFEAMQDGTEAESACLAFQQDVCPVIFTTLETAQEACQRHASSGSWPTSI